jgi:hypothetical protein
MEPPSVHTVQPSLTRQIQYLGFSNMVDVHCD